MAKSLTKGKIVLFAIGQLGWAMLSGIISNWLVYFYQPDSTAVAAGHTVFIVQGTVVLGIATVIGAITALGRVFDAFTDPLVASLSDKCRSKNGRRIPFLKWSALPFAVVTVLVFWSPVNGVSTVNAIFLFLMMMAYYFCITLYCTPFNALIPELGHTQKERLNISTAISFTFIVGTATAYAAPYIWGALEPALGRINAMRAAFSVLAFIALICMFVPVFAIREKDYVDSAPTEGTAVSSLVKTFRNKDFRLFVGSDIAYWIALTIFQTGLPFVVTRLLGLEEGMMTVFFVTMTALSLLFYLPVNLIAPKLGKKKLILFAFVGFTVAFIYTAFSGNPLGFSPTAQGYVLCILAALPMAIFGILPQAVVADISQSDSVLTGENREGMFYAARTFAFKLGQSVAMLLFTALSTIGADSGLGYRIAAGTAAAICLLGGIIFLWYNEKHVNRIIEK